MTPPGNGAAADANKSALEVRVSHLEKELKCAKCDLRGVRDQILRADGGRRALIYLMAAGATASGVIGSVMTYLGMR